MAGIYVHIPFCKQACHFCNFHFSTSLKNKEQLLQALHQELRLQNDYLNGETVESIYFGGGTPSLLNPFEINAVVELISHLYGVAANAEITIEVNPDDVAFNTKGLKDILVNRVSVGVQSFFDEDLLWMHRSHASEEAELAILRLQDAGFQNISIDLLYGYPLLTDQKWSINLAKAFQLEVPHVSSYCMTVEPKTVLAKRIAKNQQEPMDDSQGARHFAYLMQRMQQEGFEHYEISNFCKPGLQSRHNAGYWKGVRYLGIGPSAHSFNGKTRQWNIADNTKYIQAISNGVVPAECEILTIENLINEYTMISLRTSGIDLNEVGKRFGLTYQESLEKGLCRFIQKEWLLKKDNVAQLTTIGKLYADHVIAALFFDNEAL